MHMYISRCHYVRVNLYVYLQVESFYSLVEKSALYGAANSTVCSLLLTVLPRPRHKYKEALQSYTTDDNAKHSSKATQLLNLLQKSLHEMGGFCYTEVCKVEHMFVYIATLMYTFLESGHCRRTRT